MKKLVLHKKSYHSPSAEYIPSLYLETAWSSRKLDILESSVFLFENKLIVTYSLNEFVDFDIQRVSG